MLEKRRGAPIELACHLFILLKTQRFEIRTPLTRSNRLLEKIKGTASEQLKRDEVPVTQSLTGYPETQRRHTLQPGRSEAPFISTSTAQSERRSHAFHI